jgi:hypothetical protein
MLRRTKYFVEDVGGITLQTDSICDALEFHRKKSSIHGKVWRTSDFAMLAFKKDAEYLPYTIGQWPRSKC